MMSISQPKVTIVVPIYNMEKLMKRCLDGIREQTFDNFECLLVDDGSTDSSLSICKEYSSADSRFLTLHKPNGGLSDARNYGLQRAQGEYVTFWDPDDWVEEKYLQALVTVADEKSVDMVMADLWMEDEFGHNRYVKQQPSSFNPIDLIPDFFEGGLQAYTWNKLIRRDFYLQHRVSFPNIYGCEDLYTLLHLLLCKPRVAYLNKAYYHYVQYATSSLSKYYDAKTLDNDLRARNLMTGLVAKGHLRDIIYKSLSQNVVRRAFKYGYKFYSSSQYQILFAEYKEYFGLNTIENILIRFSCDGYYRSCHLVYKFLLGIKQGVRRICS